MSRYLAPLCVAIALALGIAAAPYADSIELPELSRWFVTIACAAFAVRRPAWLLAAAFAFGLARHANIDDATLPRGERGARVVADDRGIDRITGVVTGPVVAGEHHTGALLVTADADVWVWSSVPLAPGERVAIHGMVRSARPASGPSFHDRADQLATHGARFELAATHVERLGHAPGLVVAVWRAARSTQQQWADRIANVDGDRAAKGALAGIAIGARAQIPAELDERWRRTGIFHVLSVSGLHLAVVAGLAFLLLRRAAAASPWGHRIAPARWAAPPAFAIALAYTLVTGGQLATWRALVVAMLVFVAAMLDRPLRLVDALGVAAIALLAWRPGDLYDAGFQLSFTAALVLALQPRGLPELPSAYRSGLHRYGARAGRWIARGFVTSVWITLATAPITAYHFQQIMPSGVVGNLLLTPALELVALPLALAGLVAGSDTLLTIAVSIVELVDGAAAVLAEVAVVGRVALVGAPLLAVVVAISLALVARSQQRTRIELALWLALCLAWSFGREAPPDDALRVTFLDVGQGDAALVELPDGAVWLVDAGGRVGARDARATAAPGVAIERALTAYGHDRIDLAIISHPHPDHYAGLARISAPIEELWYADEPEPTAEGAAFADFTAQLRARGTKIVKPPRGTVRVQSGVELVTWWPTYRPTASTTPMLAADPVRSVNDNSLVVEVRYRGRSILFAGDLEAEGELGLVDELSGDGSDFDRANGDGSDFDRADVYRGGGDRIDVVKVPHHGSRTSSTPAFVARTRPHLAVISCGLANQFGFPATEVGRRWVAAGAHVARTDLDGSVTVVIDSAGGLSWHTALRGGSRYLPAVP